MPAAAIVLLIPKMCSSLTPLSVPTLVVSGKRHLNALQ
jgi:hypothetical protein